MKSSCMCVGRNKSTYMLFMDVYGRFRELTVPEIFVMPP